MIQNFGGLIRNSLLGMRVAVHQHPKRTAAIACAIIAALALAIGLSCYFSDDFKAYIQTHHGQAVIGLTVAAVLSAGMLIYVAFKYAKFKKLVESNQLVQVEAGAKRELFWKVFLGAAVSFAIIAAFLVAAYLLTSHGSAYHQFMDDSDKQIGLLCGGIALNIIVSLGMLLYTAHRLSRFGDNALEETNRRLERELLDLPQGAVLGRAASDDSSSGSDSGVGSAASNRATTRGSASADSRGRSGASRATSGGSSKGASSRDSGASNRATQGQASAVSRGWTREDEDEGNYSDWGSRSQVARSELEGIAFYNRSDSSFGLDPRLTTSHSSPGPAGRVGRGRREEAWEELYDSLHGHGPGGYIPSSRAAPPAAEVADADDRSVSDASVGGESGYPDSDEDEALPGSGTFSRFGDAGARAQRRGDRSFQLDQDSE